MKIKYKKEFLQLVNLAEKYGYWSAEVLKYNSSVPMHKRDYINNLFHGYEKNYITMEDINNG
jgi:hypothetical protein